LNGIVHLVRLIYEIIGDCLVYNTKEIVLTEVNVDSRRNGNNISSEVA